ncbi:MAG TPA: Re/Si-specific NAD(P)(+) transhydrogenase subunit alpha [Bryobacteraceae bacterium]|nr:Re/Si-specific NAD(P)(+) transhydrogenase subunit alpha [Bryobacteraceae bacterium]
MALIVGVLKETFPEERRVALTPKVFDVLKKLNAEVWIEQGAGVEAGFPDADYASKGAHLASANEVREHAGVLLHVRVPLPDGLNGKTSIGFCDPLSNPDLAAKFAAAGATLFSMELIPRISRAQSMDALSSMASIAGYKAVILAANTLPRLFPMMTTAAGTIPPARVFIMGAGVAGLQAIATARRLGAVVSGFDVRAAVREQIESLGAKFVNINLGGAKAEGEGGYAKALDEDALRLQREQMSTFMREQDVVITTAAVPGKRAPILITKEMVHAMAPGSVIVDLAAERGGNCELTKVGETVIEHGVTILGPSNLPATVPYHASQMYARNLVTLLKHLVNKEGQLTIDTKDEITRESLITYNGEVVNPRIQALLGVNV